MSRLRLAKLSCAQLLELAVDACESSPELKNKADALIAKVAPLPLWCVDVLLSPDLLPQLFSSFGLSEHAAAGVCTTWSHAYSRQLRRCRYVDPRRVRELADVPTGPAGLCMLPGGVLAITAHNDSHPGVYFVAARSDSDPQALAVCRSSSLAARRFGWLRGMAHTNDGLLVCSYNDPSTALHKFAKDGSMDELATVPALADYDQGFKKCALHQQTQRTYAIAGEAGEENHALVLLDTSLQVVATVEATGGVPDDFDPIRDVAVHGDQVIVLTSGHHAKGSGLRLLDLDGQYLRTIAAGQLQNPWVVAASHGRAFVIDDNEEDEDDNGPGKVLLVIDIQSGDIIQRVRVDLGGGSLRWASAMLVDGNDIYIGGYGNGGVVVLQLAGSEA